MGIIKSTILTIFCGHILVGLVTKNFLNNKKNTLTDKSSQLEVFNPKGDSVGYIIGSMHSGFSEDELKPLRNKINSLIIPNVEKAYIEVVTGHWSTLSVGVERVLLQEIEASKKDVTVETLETLQSQQVLMGSISFAGGGKPIRVPYGALKKITPVCNLLNITHQASWVLPNLIYQKIINPGFVQEQAQKNVILMQKMRKSFLENKTGVTEPTNVNLFDIVDRDKTIFEKIEKDLSNFNTKNKFVIVLGIMHLAADDGILSHFVKKGFTFKSL